MKSKDIFHADGHLNSLRGLVWKSVLSSVMLLSGISFLMETNVLIDILGIINLSRGNIFYDS